MHPSSTISYDLAQARMPTFRTARREGLFAQRGALHPSRPHAKAPGAHRPSAHIRPPPPPADSSGLLTQLVHRGATMSSVLCDLSVGALSTGAARADALFASALQRSDEPSPGQVRRAIAVAVAAYGGSGCAARVAQAFGEHPETAVTRMRWARTMVARAVPATCLAA